MKTLYERSMFVGDMHIPYQDRVAIKVMFAFMRWFKPHHIFIIGDMLDFYAISKFDKDPKRMDSLQEELDETKVFLAELRDKAKRAKIVFLPGNHCNRLVKYLWRHPEIAPLTVLQLENLLELDKFGIEFFKENRPYDFHEFKVEHGDIVRKKSGYTASGMLEKRGVSGISGHTHRLATHYSTDESGDTIWMENGCLCNRKPEYIFGVPNWQIGFSIGYYKRDNHRFSVEQICIVNGKAAFAGREFEP